MLSSNHIRFVDNPVICSKMVDLIKEEIRLEAILPIYIKKSPSYGVMSLYYNGFVLAGDDETKYSLALGTAHNRCDDALGKIQSYFEIMCNSLKEDEFILLNPVCFGFPEDYPSMTITDESAIKVIENWCLRNARSVLFRKLKDFVYGKEGWADLVAFCVDFPVESVVPVLGEAIAKLYDYTLSDSSYEELYLFYRKYFQDTFSDNVETILRVLSTP